MNILAFDTALDKTYIALYDGQKIQSVQIESDENNYHSAYLLPQIKKMLDEAGLLPNKLDAIAVNAGPGSFTGIRAALTVAKIMALELDIPVVSLDSCEILKCASKARDAAVLLDARRLMYYFFDGKGIELILKDDVEDKIKNRTIICDSSCMRDFGGENFINYEEQNYPLADVMTNIAIEKLEASKDIKADFSASKLKANYIQTPPVFKK